MKQKVRKSKIWIIPTIQLQQLLDTSSSFVEVLIKMGYDGYNGNHRTLKNRVKSENFDLSKMKENRVIKNKQHLEKLKNDSIIKLSDILVKDSTYNRQSLKRRLIDEGVKEYKCECCGIGDEWNGMQLSLQLDHINGINNDNRIENLRFICPNCHSQSETFSGRNRNVNIHKKCIECGCKIRKNSERCLICENKSRDGKYVKFSIDKNLLETLIHEKSFSEIGRMYGVTDNAIRKRCHKLNIDIPKFPKGHWLKK